MIRRVTLILCITTILFHNSSLGVDDFVILGLFRNKVILKIDNKQYTLSPGDTAGEGITLISADSKAAIFDINGERRSFTLGGQIGSTFAEATHGKIVSIAPDQNGMFWVNGSINKHQTKFIVDTGATLISMNKHEANRFGIDYKLIGEKALSNTAAGPNMIYIVNLRSVNVGGIEVNNVAAAVHD